MVRGRTLAFLDGDLFRKLARRPLISVFIAALTPRIALSLIVRFRFDGFLYLDDRSYLEAFRRYAETGGSEKPVIWNSVPSYSRPIALIYRFVLNDPLVALVPSVLAGGLTAVFVAVAVGRVSSARRSLLAGLLVAWWPSQIFWSSLALRDAFIWLAVSSVIAVWAVAHTSPRISVRFAVIAYTGLAIAYVSGSRKHTALVMALSALIAIALWRRSLPVLTAILVAVAITPLVFGFGVFGWSLWNDGTSTITANRSREVAAAETPITCVDLPLLPPAEAGSGGWRNDLLCFPSTSLSFVLAPFPDQVVENTSLVPPFLELPAWIALYFFSLRGSQPKLPRFVRNFTYTYLLLTFIMWSLIDRVVGTAFRHRSELLVPLVILATSNARRKPSASSVR